MTTRLLLLASFCLSLLCADSTSAAGSDLAELAPAKALAYAELTDPPALARELQALVKGSYLHNPLAFFAQHLDKQKKNNEDVLLLTWCGSPEFLAELGDLEGGFVALTGLTRNDEPEVVGVLRTGRSRMIPLALRLLLLEDEPVQCIARVEGVPIFQIGDATNRKQPLIAKRWRQRPVQLARLFRNPLATPLYPVALREDVPIEPPEEQPEFGCFVSLLPGTIAFGTTPEILSQTIRRLKKKSSEPSLATVPAFQAAASMRQHPGMFAWVDPPRLTRRINDALRRQLVRRQDEIRSRPLAKGEKRDPIKLREELRRAEIEQRRDTAEWSFLQKAANLPGMHHAAVSLSLDKGKFFCRIETHMKDKQSSPLLELLYNEKIGADLWQAVPGDAFCLLALPLTDGATRLPRLLQWADTYITASGQEEDLPSKAVAEWEKMLKLRLGRDVLAKIRAGCVALHLAKETDKEARLEPVFLVEAVNEAATTDLLALWPRLCSADGQGIQPRQHTLEGQTVYSLTDKAVELALQGPPSHYGRCGKVVVFGWDRDHVAKTLRECARKKDLLNLPHGHATVDAEGAVSALALLSCRQLLTHLAQIGSELADQGPGHRRLLGFLREMAAPMALMPPTVCSIKRLTDGVRLEWHQRELPIAAPTVVDIGLTWLLDTEATSATWLNFWFASPPAPAVPPLPPVPEGCK